MAMKAIEPTVQNDDPSADSHAGRDLGAIVELKKK